MFEKFIGLRNYVRSFQDYEYTKVFSTSFIYAGIICPALTFIPLFFALLIYDMPRRLQNWTKFAFFVPGLASGVIISQIWRWIFQPQHGFLNWVLSLFGIESVMWMAQKNTAIIGISIMTIMGGMGIPLLIYLSNILSIDNEIFDAARMDGANNLQIKSRIVFPLLIPSTLLVILLTMGAGFYILETILMMTGGGFGTQNFMYNIFHEGMNKRALGMASARSMLLFLLAISMVIGKRKLESLRRA